MNKIIPTVILFVCILSCTNSRNSSAPQGSIVFPDSVEASWTYLAGDGNVPMPRNINTNDSTLLYVLGMNKGHWIHVFDANDGTYKGSHITRGREIGQLENATDIHVNPLKGTIGVYDHKSTLHDDMKIFNTDFALTGTFNVDSLFRIVHGIFDLDSDKAIVIVPTRNAEGKSTHRTAIKLVSKQTHTVLSSYEGFESSDTLLASLYRDYSIAPSKTAIASVVVHGGALEMYKITGDSITRTFVKEYFPVQYIYTEGVEFPYINRDIQYGFRNVAASDNYIYATYCESKEEQPLVTTIGVWDWDGNPVKKIITDKDIWCLKISPNGKRLFCVSKLPGADNQLYYIDL